ncbi:nitrate/nitrite transporter [Klebsiella pneumoniae]|nr:nitrate/nitrite transporter [Klebsiella pneumoniae]
MAVFCALLFLTLPTNGQGGNFIAFFAVFMVLFLTAGLGSASTFQMISVIFRKLTMDRVKAQGGSEAQAMREAATDTAAALALSPPLALSAASLFRKRSVSRWI